MAYLNGFDASQVNPASSFDPIPAGKYLVTITESEMKPTKAGNGQYLQLTFEIRDGQYKGRRLWARLNLDNPNQQAVQIARGELSAICRVVNVLQPQDSVELHNLPLSIKVACKKREDTGEITNEVRGYEKKEAAFSQPGPMLGATPPTPLPQANMATPPAPLSQATMPTPPTPLPQATMPTPPGPLPQANMATPPGPLPQATIATQPGPLPQTTVATPPWQR
jgi:hypothetical protein